MLSPPHDEVPAVTHSFSRRTLLTGIGAAAGGAICAAVVWRLPKLARQPPVPHDGHFSAAGRDAYVEYDGWLVTSRDKKRLLLATLVYTEGWYGQETAQGSTWRWTSRTATFSFPNPRSNVLLHLEYDAWPRLFQDAPRTVTVSLGDHVLDSFTADAAGVQQLTIPVPRSVLGRRDTVEIRIAVDRTFVPANLLEGSRDARDLGIQVRRADVELARRSS